MRKGNEGEEMIITCFVKTLPRTLLSPTPVLLVFTIQHLFALAASSQKGGMRAARGYFSSHPYVFFFISHVSEIRDVTPRYITTMREQFVTSWSTLVATLSVQK